MNEPRELKPVTMFDGSDRFGVSKDFAMNVERVDHRHPAAVTAPPAIPDPPAPVETQQEVDPATLMAPQRPAQDAEPMPTPTTPTPRPDGQPPAPDAVVVTEAIPGIPDDLLT
jgi:hypothetical protein